MTTVKIEQPILSLKDIGATYGSGWRGARGVVDAGPIVEGGKESRPLKQHDQPWDMDGIKNISLEIRAGEFFGLVGESGSGKTTLARLITGQLPCGEGNIVFKGTDITRLKGKKRILATGRGIQMVFQDPYNSFNPQLSIGFQMEEPLLIGGIKDVARRRAMAVEMLDKIGLSDEYMERYPRELSGGQLQRIAIGAALIGSPDLLIADEPVSALDVSVQAQILDLFQHLRDELKFACLFISHDLNVVYYLCDKVAVLSKGELVEQGSVEQVYHRPSSACARMLTGRVRFTDEDEQT